MSEKGENTDKHSCCSVHLKPLLERIGSLEQKLLLETERREKEYNELLHILVSVKRQVKEGGKSHINIQSEKTISRLTIGSSKGKKKEVKLTEDDAKVSPAAKSAKKVGKPIRKSSINIKKIDLNNPVQLNNGVKLTKEAEILQTLERHQSEISKTSELSNYLMEQLLILFEKAKESHVENAGSPKSFPTQQTINSMVFESPRKEKTASEASGTSLAARLQKLQSVVEQQGRDARESNSKLTEHESMLSELIALTRSLSNRLADIPLFINSFDASPTKL